MDQLSKFMGGVPIEEPNAFDKLAYASAMNGLCTDESFLSQFEGTPLAPQAVALAEQELAMEQRHLQARMARDAQMQSDSYMREGNEREGLRLQKMQLCIELHKMKAMGQGAPTPPGQAVIGEPQPGAPAELGMGPAGGAPVEEQNPDPAMGAGKLASLIENAARKGWSQTVKPMTAFARTVSPTKVAAVTDDEAQYLPEMLPGGSSYVGYQRGKQTGRGLEGMARGAAGGIGGGALGALPGHILMALGQHGRPALAMAGAPIAAVGGLLGGAHGTHMATRGMLAQNAEKQAAVTDDEAQYLPQMLPFGSSYVGYQRGKQTGRGMEGAARGIAGSAAGGALGSIPGGLLAMLAGSKNPELEALGHALAFGGGIVGGAHGNHLATRSLLAENQKQASLKTFAQKLRTGA